MSLPVSLHWSRSSFLIVLVSALVPCCSTSARAEADKVQRARNAFEEGDYRKASGLLEEVDQQAGRSDVELRIAILDLQTEVLWASGRLEDSLELANRHLEAVRKLNQAYDSRYATQLQETLVRTALIGRSLYDATIAAKQASLVPNDAWLARSRERLLEALSIHKGMLETSDDKPEEKLLWRPDVLIELGFVQELAGEDSEATRSFTDAVKLLRPFAEDFSHPVRVVHAIQLIRIAHPRNSQQHNKQQALLTQTLADTALASDQFTPVQRYDLLTLVAQCAQQLGDAEREETSLLLAVQLHHAEDRVATASNAKHMIRLAELSARKANEDAADNWYQKAAVGYRSLLNKEHEQETTSDEPKQSPVGQQIEYLQQLQLIYTRLEWWDKAIPVVEQLLAKRDQLLLDNDPNRFRTISALGSLHTKAARSAQAKREFGTLRKHAEAGEKELKKAVSFWRKYKLAEGVELAMSLNNLAEVSRYNGQFHQASVLLEEVAPLQEKISSPGDISLAEFHANRAAVLAALGQFDPAGSLYQLALDGIQLKRSDQQKRRLRLEATTLLNLAQLYKSQRSFQKASEICDKALKVAKAAWPGGDGDGIERVQFMLVSSSLRIAQSQVSKDHEQLLVVVKQAEETLEILSNAGLQFGFLSATAEHLQAVAQYLLGERNLAKAGWERVVEKYDAPESNIVVVRSLNYLVRLELDETRNHRRLAGNSVNRVEFDLEIAASKTSLKSAQAYSEQAMALSQSIIAYPTVQFLTRYRLAQTLQAQAQTQSSKDKDSQARAFREQAISALMEAIDVIERPRAMVVGAEEQRAEYFSQFAAGFDFLIDLLVEQGDFDSAIRISERRRSRTFLDQMRASGVDPRDSLAPGSELLEKEREKLGQYYEKLGKIRRPDEHADATVISNLAEELKELRAELLEIRNQIFSASSAIRQLIHTPATVSAGASAGEVVSGNLADSLAPDAMALIYHIGTYKSYLFVVQQGQPIRCFDLALNDEQMAKLVLSELKATKPGEQRPLSEKLAVELVNLVLQGIVGGAYRDIRGVAAVPVTALKVNDETLVAITDVLLPRAVREEVFAKSPPYLLIVPDGALHQLPLEALLVDAEDKQYILDVFPATCYAPSLAVFRLLTEQSASSSVELQVLTVGDPFYRQQTDNNAIQVDRLSGIVGDDFLSLGGSLAPLDGTSVECDGVYQAFKADAGHTVVIKLQQEEATEQKVRAELPGKHIVHLAAHGLVDQQANNLFGAIALSTTDHPTPEDDGFLSLYEIYQLPLQSCELTILSACKTNCGPRRPLEAGSTLSRAFLCAGAKRVVCSHWNVDDKITPILIKSFVNEVAQKIRSGDLVNYAEALHQARRELRDDDKTADPRFWAAFVLVGPPYSAQEGLPVR